MSARRLELVPIAVCLAFGLAACGDDGYSNGETSTPADDGYGGYDYSASSTATSTTVSDSTADTSTAPDALILKREGNILVDGAGMTLYIFTNDPPDTSTCNAGCVDTWPPVVVEGGGFTLQGDVDPTDYGVVVRDDGTQQVSYQGQPLYYYSGDSAPGDTNGDGIGGVWFMVEFS